jgi:hypothetical protein
VRRKVVVPRTSMKVAAVALAGGLSVCACSTTQIGAAAVTGSSRITSTSLTAQVASLNSAYAADKAKGVSPQRPRGQETQQVLTWLILFRVYDKMAAQHGFSVTPEQEEAAQKTYAAEAKQSNVSPVEYWSAGAALPPDLLPELYRAAAIQEVMVTRLAGGKTPTTSAAQSAVDAQLSHQQCLAAKGLGITVNPQFGEYDYNGYSVVTAPSTLAANQAPSPSPSPSASPTRLTPPC